MQVPEAGENRATQGMERRPKSLQGSELETACREVWSGSRPELGLGAFLQVQQEVPGEIRIRGVTCPGVCSLGLLFGE